MDISEIVSQQRAYFDTGATRALTFRKQALEKLKSALIKNEASIFQALQGISINSRWKLI